MTAGTTSQASYNYGVAGSLVMASGIMSVAQGAVGLMSASNARRRANLQARQINLQAMERSNQLLEQFQGAMGNLNFNAVRRGVKVGEGSVMRNIELSSKSLGEDIHSMRTGARLKADATRAEGKILSSSMRIQSGTQIASGLLGAYQGQSLRNYGSLMQKTPTEGIY